jgi:hypothetical protein
MARCFIEAFGDQKYVALAMVIIARLKSHRM